MEQFSSEFDREVAVGCDITRRAVIRRLEALSFKLDRSRGSLIEAHSGSPWLPRIGSVSRPTRIRITMLGDAIRTRVHVRLSDAESMIVDPAASLAAYTTLFTHVTADLDERLSELDPSMRSEAAATMTSEPDDPSKPRQFVGLAQRAAAMPGIRAFMPERTILLRSGDHKVELDDDEAEMMLAVASIAAADPGIPARLGPRMTSLQLGLAAAVRDPRGHPVVDVESEDRRLVDFLARQARIRAALPARELQRCNDCGQTKIVNIDLRKSQGRRRALLDLVGIASSVLTSSFGAVTTARSLISNPAFAGPRFTCPRCEGTSVETTLVTICPRCRAIRSEPVLRTCSEKGCGFDFATSADARSDWTERSFESNSTSAGRGVSPPVLDRARAAAQSVRSARSVASADVDADAPVPHTSTADPAPGWYPDPAGRHQWRWFAEVWTSHVCDEGAISIDS